MPNTERHEIVSTYKLLTRKARHHRFLLERFTKQRRREYSLREQSCAKSKGNLQSATSVGDIVIIKNDSTKRNFWKLGKVEQLLMGEDCIVRAAVVRVKRERSQLLRRSIQLLIPIEVKPAEGDEYT